MAIATPQEAAAVFKNRVFLVKISIGQPAGNITFDAEQTRKQNFVQTLKEAGGRAGKDSLPVFQVVDESGKVIVSAKKAHTRAATVLDGLQETYMVSAGRSGSWYVPESKIEDLEKDLENQLQMEINVLAEELSTVYDEAEADFDERLKATLEAAGIMEYYEYYRHQFPSREELRSNFTIRIEQWEPMKSLEEVIELAEVDKARRKEIEVVKAQLRELRESAPKIEDDLFKQAAKALSILEDNELAVMKDDERRNKLFDQLKEIEDRVLTLVELWAKIDDRDNWVSKTFYPVRSLILSAERGNLVEAQCWELRSKWREQLAVSPVKAGGKALHAWLYPELKLDQQLADVQAKLKEDPENEKLLKRLDDLKFALAIKVSKLQELLGTEFTTPIELPELPELPSDQPESNELEQVTQAEPIEADEVELSQPEQVTKPAKRAKSPAKGKTSRKPKAPKLEVDPEVAEAGF